MDSIQFTETSCLFYSKEFKKKVMKAIFLHVLKSEKQTS